MGLLERRMHKQRGIHGLRWGARIALTAASVAAAAACGATAIVVAEYPAQGRNEVITSADGGAPDGAAPDGGQGPERRYWSAYVQMEPQDIPRLWGLNEGLDYLFISAKANIPTRSGVLSRNFPLYIVEKGRVEAQSGVDLLEKFPLSESARKQVTLTIEAKLIKDEKILKSARSIVKETDQLAKPYLASYPIASQIIGAAVPLIDQLLDTSKIEPSSTTTALIPEDIVARGNDLRAYLLLRADRLRDATTSGAITYPDPLYECGDMAGMLCKGSKDSTYQKHRVTDVPYLTISFRTYDDVFDPAILVRDAKSDCGRISATAIQQARDYLSTNEDLFDTQDIDLARTALRHAEAYLRLKELALKGSVGELLDTLDRDGQSPPLIGTDQTLAAHHDAIAACIGGLWHAAPAYQVWQAWNLYHRINKAGAAGVVCPGAGSADAVRLDVTGAALASLATVAGLVDYDISNRTAWQGVPGMLVKLMHADARMMLAEQAGLTFEARSCRSPEQARALAKQVSLVACTDCWKHLEEACKEAGQPALRALLDERARRRDIAKRILAGMDPSKIAECQ